VQIRAIASKTTIRFKNFVADSITVKSLLNPICDH